MPIIITSFSSQQLLVAFDLRGLSLSTGRMDVRVAK